MPAELDCMLSSSALCDIGVDLIVWLVPIDVVKCLLLDFSDVEHSHTKTCVFVYVYMYS